MKKAQYRSILRRTKIRFGSYELEEIDKEMIQGYIYDLTKRERLSPYYVLGIYIFLAIVFKEAVLNEKINRTPCVDIALPKTEKQRFFIKPTLAELEVICEEINPRYRVAVWLMHGLGLRIGEALGASQLDILGGGDTFRAHRQITQRGETSPLKHREWGQFRDIPMTRFTHQKIQEHIEEFGVEEDGRLIRGAKKPLPSHDGLRDGFVRGLLQTELPPTMRPHDLRHAWVSDLLAGGVPITEVSRWTGHVHVTTTQRIYGHEVPSSLHQGRMFLEHRYESLVAGKDPANVGFSWVAPPGGDPEHGVPGLAA
ncbi:tyrosine-type recombinase/integrase [Nocardiopsis baichengensis]|uniref:tyrosine-type recombinase/integrase n=1 Tax=Nocardiopsis baichengensis TaxID=280240 RepID=UPI0003482F93|nr:site-specific integrase [Nocardiopsis baichengensis]